MRALIAILAGLLLTTALPVRGQERVLQQPRVQPQPQVESQVQVQPRPSSNFDRLAREALAARRPGGGIAAESNALLRKLEAQYVTRVEAENTRIQALAKTGFPRPRPGPPGPGGDPSDAADVAVSAEGADLGLDPCGKPEAPLEVEGVQATPPLDPGEWVLVQGCGLGTSPGKLRLTGDFPGGYQDLDIKHWAPTQVSAQLPMVAGVGDMPAARLQLVRQDGKFSNLLDVGGFRATREVKRIHPNDVIVTCGASWPGDDAECIMAKSHPLSESQFFGGATFAAKHGDHVEATCESALDKLGRAKEHTDAAAVSLANGWVLAGYAWWWNPLTGNVYVLPPSGFNVNASSASVSMQWGANVNKCLGPQDSQVRYRVDLYGVGPKGVSYK